MAWLKKRDITHHTLYFSPEKSPEEDVVVKKGLKRGLEKGAKTGRCRECEPAKSNRREALRIRKAKKGCQFSLISGSLFSNS